MPSPGKPLARVCHHLRFAICSGILRETVTDVVFASNMYDINPASVDMILEPQLGQFYVPYLSNSTTNG